MIEDAGRSTSEALLARVAELEAALATEHARAEDAIAERDRLREGYRHLQLEVELARRRLVIAKAERVDTQQLELEFAAKLRELDVLAGRLPGATESDADDDAAPRGKGKARPKGRRRLADLDLPEERFELADPALEGSAARIGTEDSYKLMWRRAGYVRLVIARVKYKVGDGDAATIATAELPRELITRSLAAPSLLAHIANDKFCDGLPLHRQEDRFARIGARIDRGSMCRWLEDLGMSVGATVVAAMRDDALAHAFCIATDATGVLVQPIPSGDKQPRACARGHYFVQIADADHVFFEYTAKETSAAVAALFRGFSGYIQADAKSVHDVLFRPPAQRPPPDDDADADLAERHEVGCWAHARRKFWEAAITKDPVAREGLARITRIFALDRSWRDKPAAEIKALRELHLRPHTDAFFAWVEVQYERVRDQRGFLRTALGYAHRQRGPLTRFYDDGRLRLDNNASERALRRIAVGRKAWLFVGSDDHAQAAGNLMTLISSARLDALDPEAYLRDLFRRAAVLAAGAVSRALSSRLARDSRSARRRRARARAGSTHHSAAALVGAVGFALSGSPSPPVQAAITPSPSKDGVRAAGTRKATDHRSRELRHTFGTHAARFGVNPWQLMEWMGHKRIDETMGYVHIAERHRSIPAEIVEAGMHEMDPTARVLAMLAARGKTVAKTSVAEVTSRKKSAG